MQLKSLRIPCISPLALLNINYNQYIMKRLNKEICFALVAIVLGILTRTIFDLGDNIEMVTGFAIIAGFFFKDKRLAFSVPLFTMIISDIFIRNTAIFIFTWSGFLSAPFLGIILEKLVSKLKVSKFSFGILGTQTSGIISTLVFFLWTNFGVWLIGNLYTKDFAGLILSYINAIPFLTNQLVGNLVLLPIIFVFGYVIFNLDFAKVKNLNLAK